MSHVRNLIFANSPELMGPVAPRAAAPAMPPERAYPSVTGSRPIPALRVLWRRKWTLILFALVGGLLAASAVWRLPYIYQAQAVLEVRGLNENLLNRRDLDPTAETDNSSQNYINTVAKLLQNDLLFERVAQRLNQPDAGNNQAAPAWKPPVTKNEIASSVRVVTHDTDRIIDVMAEAGDPRRAAAIANTLSTEFIQQELEARWQSGKSTSEWLTHELSDLANKLRASEQELQSFTQRSNLLIDDGQGSVAETRLRELQGALARAQDDRINKESIYENVKNGTQLATVADNTVEQYQIQLTTLQKQLAELEATYAPGYYKIPPLKAEIASVQKALTRQRQVAGERVENDYRAAVRREQMLRTQYNEQFRDTANDTSKMVHFNSLKKAVEVNRQIYAEMLQKVKGYSVTSAMQASNLRLVDPAEPPRWPKRPNKTLITILGAMGFFCAGILWSVARAAGNRSIAEPGDAQQFLRSPELGVIPAVKADPLARRAGFNRRGFWPRRNGSRTVETVTWKCSPSLMAESFRSASASLLLPCRGDQRQRVLLVTSMSPGEGKTTVASNIAIAMAGAAGRVLLVDADRRRPRLHIVFERSNKSGLSELLCSDCSLERAAESILATPVSNLFLLPNGTAMLDRPDLLYSGRMSALIAQMRRDFDVVIIDTPPLLHLSDARILGRLSDGVILVLRAGRVRWDSAMAVERRLHEDGITILGTVLNDWHPKKDGYGVYPDNKGIEMYLAS